MIVILMGVAGSGKTTIGRMLAEALRFPFLDGDSLHSTANIDKMSHGVPLTDADRRPWLEAIRRRLLQAHAQKQDLVLACSALKRDYREFLASGVPVTWVYLKGSEELIQGRIDERQGHYMKSRMLPSQFADLEEPSDAVIVDVSLQPRRIVEQILACLSARAANSNIA